MAIQITQQGIDYHLEVSPPESQWIKGVAKSMGITKEAVIGAAMNYGLAHYVTVFRNTGVIEQALDD